MIKNDKFDQELLGKIKKEHITPKPKWHFLLKNYIILASGFISLLIGGVASSVIIYFLRNSDWDIYRQTEGSLSQFILVSLPYFWLIFLAIFIFIVYYNIKHSKTGYRYPLYAILIANICLSVFLGIVFYNLGIGQLLDDISGERIPMYNKIFNRQIDLWSNSDEGRLSGIILSKIDENRFYLLDLNQKKWIIINMNVRLELPFPIKPGDPIRIIGEKISEEEFQAEKILPPPLPGRGFFKQHKNRSFAPPFQGEIQPLNGTPGNSVIINDKFNAEENYFFFRIR